MLYVSVANAIVVAVIIIKRGNVGAPGWFSQSSTYVEFSMLSMVGGMLAHLFSYQLYQRGALYYIPLLQMRKCRHRKGKQLIPGSMAGSESEAQAMGCRVAAIPRQTLAHPVRIPSSPLQPGNFSHSRLTPLSPSHAPQIHLSVS